MATTKQDLIVNSIIGEGTNFRGDFDLNGLLRIDGGFTGLIESKGRVLVGRHGIVNSNKIKARTIVVGGTINGNIWASEKVSILSTGVINGNIETPLLSAEEGVIINGKIKITKKSKTAQPNQEKKD